VTPGKVVIYRPQAREHLSIQDFLASRNNDAFEVKPSVISRQQALADSVTVIRPSPIAASVQPLRAVREVPGLDCPLFVPLSACSLLETSTEIPNHYFEHLWFETRIHFSTKSLGDLPVGLVLP
jgi:hypothetical protein